MKTIIFTSPKTKTFSYLSNQQLVDKINRAPDFGYDDEEAELVRRIEKSNGKMRVEMQGNTAVLINIK